MNTRSVGLVLHRVPAKEKREEKDEEKTRTMSLSKTEMHCGIREAGCWFSTDELYSRDLKGRREQVTMDYRRQLGFRMLELYSWFLWKGKKWGLMS